MADAAVFDIHRWAGLDALFARLPDVLVYLQAEARGKAIRKHPLDDKAWVERGVVGAALVGGCLAESW